MTGTPVTAPFSLSELRFYLVRAGVGVGAPFGVAEDFAEMAVFVARMGIDPAPLAAAALDFLASGESTPAMSMRDNHLVPGDGNTISCLFAGGTLCDYLTVQTTQTTQTNLTVGPVDCPLLVAAFLYSMGEGQYVASWPDVTIVVRDGRPKQLTAPDVSALCNPAAATIVVRPGGQGAEGALFDAAALKKAFRRPLNEGVSMDHAAWLVIQEHFRKYLVPSSDEARATAAGAGLVDTD